jgi:hypothetical protein
VGDEEKPDHLDFPDPAGHRWRVEFDDSEPPVPLRIYCVRCEGSPRDYWTGAPAEYRPCPAQPPGEIGLRYEVLDEGETPRA